MEKATVPSMVTDMDILGTAPIPVLLVMVAGMLWAALYLQRGSVMVGRYQSIGNRKHATSGLQLYRPFPSSFEPGSPLREDRKYIYILLDHPPQKSVHFQLDM